LTTVRFPPWEKKKRLEQKKMAWTGGPKLWDLLEDRPIPVLQQLDRMNGLDFPGEKGKKYSTNKELVFLEFKCVFFFFPSFY
jgi:hypothetical protein